MQGGNGNIRFLILLAALLGGLYGIDEQFIKLKNDPVCEHARAVVDSMNAKNEEHHVRFKTK